MYSFKSLFLTYLYKDRHFPGRPVTMTFLRELFQWVIGHEDMVCKIDFTKKKILSLGPDHVQVIGSESVLQTESKLERFSTKKFCNSLYL